MNDPYRHPIDRREALLRISAALAAGGAVTAGGIFFHDRRIVSPSARPVPDWRTDEAHLPPGVIARGSDPAANVRRALDALGGVDRFVARGHTVLIKPNVGWDRLPEQAADTNPQVVAELVRLSLAAGARRVIVADISCNDPARSFEHSGIGPAARAAGAIVLVGPKIRLVRTRTGGPAAGLEVMEALLDADRVINVPVVKQHSLSLATLGMKNWFGVLGRGRARLHQNINHSIAELAATFRPTLTVIDATRILTANGPQGGSLADVREVHALAAGIDPVACDAWGATLLGLEPRRVGYIAAAEGRGLGRADPRLLEDLGTA
ncbi:MAG: DUF362 domain-containing protein [Acidobacteria bacterium]|nr:DUF362 domain-containing protein [Acidobacteriota bacterium]